MCHELPHLSVYTTPVLFLVGVIVHTGFSCAIHVPLPVCVFVMYVPGYGDLNDQEMASGFILYCQV